MAIIRQGILGGVQNKIGSVVGTSWKGIAVLKSLPLSVANPRTTPQVNQRTKFAAVVAFASAINSAIIKPLWDRFAIRQSGNNAFVSANIENFNDSGDLATPATLITSRGKMGATPIATAGKNALADQIQVTWTPILTDGFQASTDEAFVVAYNETQNKFSTNTAETRVDGVAILSMTGLEASDVVHTWLAFRRVDGTIVSDSSYKLTT